MSKFNEIYINNEKLNGFHIIDTNWDKKGICKRCGKEFKKKYKKQIFCSGECASKFKLRMNEMKKRHGKKFMDWLNGEIDYSYSPERYD